MAYTQDIDACLKSRRGFGLTEADFSDYLKKADKGLDQVRADQASNRLPLLRLAGETSDLQEIREVAALLVEAPTGVQNAV